MPTSFYPKIIDILVWGHLVEIFHNYCLWNTLYNDAPYTHTGFSTYVWDKNRAGISFIMWECSRVKHNNIELSGVRRVYNSKESETIYGGEWKLGPQKEVISFEHKLMIKLMIIIADFYSRGV